MARSPQRLFGKSSDFGVQGPQGPHPKRLQWLKLQDTADSCEDISALQLSSQKADCEWRLADQAGIAWAWGMDLSCRSRCSGFTFNDPKNYGPLQCSSWLRFLLAELCNHPHAFGKTGFIQWQRNNIDH